MIFPTPLATSVGVPAERAWAAEATPAPILRTYPPSPTRCRQRTVQSAPESRWLSPTFGTTPWWPRPSLARIVVNSPTSGASCQRDRMGRCWRLGWLWQAKLGRPPPLGPHRSLNAALDVVSTLRAMHVLLAASRRTQQFRRVQNQRRPASARRSSPTASARWSPTACWNGARIRDPASGPVPSTSSPTRPGPRPGRRGACASWGPPSCRPPPRPARPSRPRPAPRPSRHRHGATCVSRLSPP